MTPAGVIAGGAAALTVAAFGARRGPDPFGATLLAPGAAIRVEHPAGHRRIGEAVPPADELPLLLDLLATATAAGMSGTLAFDAAVAALRGTLGRALGAVVAANALGAPLTEGVREVAATLAIPDLARAATLLERSGSLGVPVSVALRELAAEHRRGRRRAAELRARTAPVRMLFPLVFLVLPAFLLLTVVPMLLATLGSLS